MTTLAIDLGTSAIKFLRVDHSLRVVHLDRVPVSRLDVPTWFEMLRRNIEMHGDDDKIDRICITGQMHGLVTLERDGYGNGIPWTDQRGGGMLPALNARLGPGLATRTGGPLATGFMAVSLAWLKANDPERWSRIRKAMLPKDALVHTLTGEHVTDPSDAAGTGMLDITTGDWAWDVVDAIGIPRAWLPDIVPCGSVVGRIRPDIAATLGMSASTEVIIAGGDTPVGAYGAGAIQEDALVTLSSGAQVILPAATFAPDPAGQWYTWPAARPVLGQGMPYIRVGTLLNGGNAISWLRDVLGRDITIADAPTRLIALPHLLGERTPFQDAKAKGAILGLTPDTSAADIHRAMLEGVGYSLRHALEEMCGASALPTRILIGAGGANIRGWQQIITDILQIPTSRIATTELTAFGAAAIAQGQEPAPALEALIEPEQQHKAMYDERYAVYREAIVATRSISHSIASLDGASA